MKNIFYFTAIALFSFSAFSQPVNDNCSGAISLGTLGNPAACGGGIMSGTITSVSGDLTGATPENPYLYQFGCVGGGMASPANDVWYSFVVPANGSQVKVVVSGAAFTPNIALWSGSCSSMIGRGCSVGTIGTGTLNVAGLSPGQTYMIQISGNSGETGAFNLKVSAFQDCSNCEIGSNLTVNPLPVNNSYPLGQRVNFCYHITNFSQVNTNWLHGVQISFGSGWDLSSLTTTTFTGCDGQGVWSYYPGGTTSLANGTQWPAGFYYDSKQVGGCNCLDNNPGNNFGDNCTGSISGGTWNFCFSIAVSSTCTPLADLAVTIGTTGDGQSGNWTNAGCANDPKLNFNAALQECCSKNVSINAVNTICIGQTDLLTASGVSSYTWSTGSNLDTISVSPTVNSTYTVSGTDSTGCVSIATKSITVNSLPVLSVTSATICPGATATLSVSPTTLSSYTWSPGLSSTSGYSVTGSPAVTTNYTVSATNSNGCRGTNTVSINVMSAPTITASASNSQVCSGSTVTLSCAGANSYSWSSSDGNANGMTGSSITVVPSPTLTSYYVYGSNGTCTSTVYTLNVGAYSLPNVTAAPTPNLTSICVGASIILNGQGAMNYTWTNGVTDGVAFTPTATSTYTVSGIDANGCINSGIITITVNPLPIISISENPAASSVCIGTPVTLNGQGAMNYTWTNGITDGVAFTPTATSTYTVNGKDANGCTNSGNITITVNALPIITILENPDSATICSGTIITLNGQGATNYTWTNGITDGVAFTPTATSTYTVTGSDSNGCNNSDTITVNVNNCTTGIANLTENGAQIFVYPNPVRDILTFRSNNRIGPVSIYDCLNNLIYQNTINSFQANIDLIEIPEGVYFVKVQGKYIKILKQ